MDTPEDDYERHRPAYRRVCCPHVVAEVTKIIVHSLITLTGRARRRYGSLCPPLSPLTRRYYRDDDAWRSAQRTGGIHVSLDQAARATALPLLQTVRAHARVCVCAGRPTLETTLVQPGLIHSIQRVQRAGSASTGPSHQSSEGREIVRTRNGTHTQPVRFSPRCTPVLLL